nr:MAG TPA: hypothetical protein [Caudoviricetes sp.]
MSDKRCKTTTLRGFSVTSPRGDARKRGVDGIRGRARKWTFQCLKAERRATYCSCRLIG